MAQSLKSKNMLSISGFSKITEGLSDACNGLPYKCKIDYVLSAGEGAENECIVIQVNDLNDVNIFLDMRFRIPFKMPSLIERIKSTTGKTMTIEMILGIINRHPLDFINFFIENKTDQDYLKLCEKIDLLYDTERYKV